MTDDDEAIDEEVLVRWTRPLAPWFAVVVLGAVATGLIGPSAFIAALVVAMAAGFAAAGIERPVTVRIRVARVEVRGWLGSWLPLPGRRAFDLASLQLQIRSGAWINNDQLWTVVLADDRTRATLTGFPSLEAARNLREDLLAHAHTARERHGAGEREIPRELRRLRAPEDPAPRE